MRHVAHKVFLNGRSLAEVDPRLIVLAVNDIEPKETRNTMAFGGRDGGFLTERRRDELTVRVEFAIRERFDREAWTRALMAARSWCGDGRLEISDRPGQFLDVICTKLPAAGKKIFDGMTAEFTAYSFPYWRMFAPETAEATPLTDGTLWVPGDGVETPVDVTVTATEALTELVVTAGDTQIALSDISIAQGMTVVFSHDGSGFLRIVSGTDSLLNKRTASSSDDLTIPSGASSTVSVTAGEAVFSARGCFR